MTLDEAIRHAEEVAKRLETSCKRDWMGEDDERCASEHRRLAEWLKDYKRLLEQQPCEDVPDINDGNIYKCSCGYGWDKSKVVRHHFCPNCGKPVDSSIKPCEDCISRQAAKKALEDRFMELQKIHSDNKYETNFCLNTILELPSVTPLPKIGHWIRVDNDKCKCDRCEVVSFIAMYPNGDKNYCPNCGAIMQAESEV